MSGFEFKLTPQDIPPENGRLDLGPCLPPVTKANTELLVWMSEDARLATVDDLLAWEHHNQGRGACINRCGHTAPVGLREGCRVYCPECGTHTVCSAKDIAAGHTPGPVAERNKE